MSAYSEQYESQNWNSVSWAKKEESFPEPNQTYYDKGWRHPWLDHQCQKSQTDLREVGLKDKEEWKKVKSKKKEKKVNWISIGLGKPAQL